MSSAAQPLPGENEADGAREAGVLGGALAPAQLDLLREDDGRLPDNVFQLARAEEAKRPGRPKGSRNKRSSNLAAVLQAKYSDPVEFQASVYDMPLDQLCEALLIADGTVARQRKLDAMLLALSERVDELTGEAKRRGVPIESIERLAEACEALEGAARRSQGKPGDVALKALNLQLQAARTVAEYVHSKKPVEAVVRHQADAVLMMPAAQGGAAFDAVDETTRMAGDLLAKALASGQLTGSDIVGLRLHDGQLVDAEFEEVPLGPEDEAG